MEFPIKVAELFMYKEGKPHEKVTIQKVKEEEICTSLNENKSHKDTLMDKCENKRLDRNKR